MFFLLFQWWISTPSYDKEVLREYVGNEWKHSTCNVPLGHRSKVTIERWLITGLNHKSREEAARLITLGWQKEYTPVLFLNPTEPLLHPDHLQGCVAGSAASQGRAGSGPALSQHVGCPQNLQLSFLNESLS